VSVGQASPDGDSVRRLRRQVEHAIEQLAALSGSSLPPAEFYQELLRKGLAGIDAPAGAIWLKTPQGFLQQQCQHDLGKIGLDDRPDGRQAHNQLLRFAYEKKKPGILGPRMRAEGDRSAGNPTDYQLALAPILTEDNDVLGVLEIFQKPNWNSQDLVTYTIHVAGYASNYLRNTSNRKVAGQEQVWTQLEVFSRQVHASLNPTEVAYVVANEGRRLIGCDRITVGVRHGRKVTIEAVSGADVVEKASTHIRRMRDLFNAVIQWGEKLTYRGDRDDTLPPKVLDALDAYLAEQNPKLLVLVPIRDPREKPKEGSKEALKPCRSAVLLEVFDPPEQTALMEQKLEVVAAHSATALYNAAEMKRVPLKPLWWPLMRIQQGLGGKARFWTFFTIGLLAALTAVMTLVPYPLKLDAKGKVVPLDRVYVFSHSDGEVVDYKVAPKQVVNPGAIIAVMRKAEWAREITGLQKQLKAAEEQFQQASNTPPGENPEQRENRLLRRENARIEHEKAQTDLDLYEQLFKCDLRNPGYYFVAAPAWRPSSASGQPRWQVASQDFIEQTKGRTVSPKDPLLRLGNVSGGWEIVLKIPQKHSGRVLKAFQNAAHRDKDGDFLWVDVLASSDPTPGAQGKGKLYHKDLAGENLPNRDDQNESEPVLLALVRINTPDIPTKDHLNPLLLVIDAEVNCRVIGEDHSLGYSLFYGVWEFLYEKVIFWF
jgi:hypothetical protein